MVQLGLVLAATGAIGGIGCARVPEASVAPWQSVDEATRFGVDEKFDAAMQRWMKERHFSGLAVVVARKGRVVLARGYGLADVEHRTPVRADTGFWLCSVSKLIVATAAMMLVEEGKIQLDDPISRYLDESPPSWQKVTVRNLLNHTSGIPDFVNESAVGVRLGGEHSAEFVLRRLARRPLKFEPGTKQDYSNSGFELLGMIIERVTGRSYDVFLRERIFEPLGMNDTFVYGDETSASRANVAVGYMWRKRWVRVNQQQPTMDHRGYAAGGIVTTALDMAKWDAGLAAGKLVSKETLKRMWSPGKFADGREFQTGLGFGLGKAKDGTPWVIHMGRWGDFGGFCSYYQRFVTEDVTVILLSNYADVDWARIPGDVWGPYFPQDAATKPREESAGDFSGNEKGENE